MKSQVTMVYYNFQRGDLSDKVEKAHEKAFGYSDMVPLSE